MKKTAYNEFSKELMEILPGGVFLTVRTANEVNTMTIGWGTVGIVWGIPIFLIAVRDSRYTYQLLKKTDEFTVSVPFKGDFKEELAFCGSKSGRDYNKFEECDLVTIPGQKVDTPVIAGCRLHYECRIRYQRRMDEKLLNEDINLKYYPDGDYHTMYYGEIIASYIDEDVRV